MEELKKILNPIFFVIILISFFLPFFNLTCQEQKVASITGFELITGTEVATKGLNNGLQGISAQQNENIKGLKTVTVSSEAWAIIAFLLTIGGLIFSFFEKFSDISSAISALLGGLSLVFLSPVITDNILDKLHYQPLGVEWGIGFYIAIMFFVLLFSYNTYLFLQRVMYRTEELHSFGAKMRSCPRCGSENDRVSIYCNKCGSIMKSNKV